MNRTWRVLIGSIVALTAAVLLLGYRKPQEVVKVSPVVPTNGDSSDLGTPAEVTYTKTNPKTGKTYAVARSSGYSIADRRYYYTVGSISDSGTSNIFKTEAEAIKLVDKLASPPSPTAPQTAPPVTSTPSDKTSPWMRPDDFNLGSGSALNGTLSGGGVGGPM